MDSSTVLRFSSKASSDFPQVFNIILNIIFNIILIILINIIVLIIFVDFKNAITMNISLLSRYKQVLHNTGSS